MAPQMTNRELWYKLTAFRLDIEQDELPFSKRLARENAWSQTFALQVIDEYKRFLYLAVAAPHPVTPSEEVDAAWHLHLCYTRSYWEELCPKVLGRVLHHNPTQGGAEQSKLFSSLYSKTLDSYQREFGDTPPPDIWPSPEKRFQPCQSKVKEVSPNYNISISKKWIHLTFASVSSGLFATGCKELVEEGELSSEGKWLFIMGVILLFFMLKAMLSSNKRRRRGKRGDGGSYHGCSTDCSSGCSGGCGGGGD